MCTMEYRPVCGTRQVSCIRPDMTYGLGERDAVCTEYATYGNRCVLESEGATFVHEGLCTDEELGKDSKDPVSPPQVGSEKKYQPLDGEIKNIEPAPASAQFETATDTNPSTPTSPLGIFSRLWLALMSWF